MLACRHDVPDIVRLARDQLPGMTYIHETEGWRNYYRFGAGLHPRDNYFVIVRINQDGPLLGLAWVDAAAAHDYGIAEPWWCINAVAVVKEVAGKGLGTALVKMIKAQAESAGVVSLYGICYPSSAGFWHKQGFALTELGGGATADGPVRMLDGSHKVFSMSGEPGNHTMALSFGGTGDRDASRLVIPSPLAGF